MVWRFSDGKPGHDNQTLGLTAALAQCRPIEVVTLPALPLWQLFASSAQRRWPELWRDRAPAQLVIGAGHATHASVLWAAHWCQAHSVVLMRPSLPLRCFDVCLIPEHDHPPPRDNVIVTRGVLNRITVSPQPDPQRGLILLGGPSKHHAWDNTAVLTQVQALIAAQPTLQWTISDSRRTPSECWERLSQWPQVQRVSARSCGPDWLPAQLAQVGQVWVTADSVSMLYEALSAGVAVGVLELPVIRNSRVVSGLQQLLTQGEVISYSSWRAGRALSPSPQALQEARRCAELIVQRWSL